MMISFETMTMLVNLIMKLTMTVGVFLINTRDDKTYSMKPEEVLSVVIADNCTFQKYLTPLFIKCMFGLKS